MNFVIKLVTKLYTSNIYRSIIMLHLLCNFILKISIKDLKSLIKYCLTKLVIIFYLPSLFEFICIVSNALDNFLLSSNIYYQKLTKIEH